MVADTAKVKIND